MRRLSMHLFLLGCAGLLLGMQGCSTSSERVSVDNARRVALAPSKEKAAAVEAPFRLPSDAAGKLLGQVLAPAGHPGRLENPNRGTPPDRTQARLKEPAVPPPPMTPDPPRPLALVKRTSVRPELVHTEALEESFSEPDVPSRPSFATGKRIQVRSEDVGLPPPLPVLAQPVPDRVPLDDATMEASTIAALSAALPVQNKPAPYQRMQVPDPYENRLPLTLSVPAESSPPQADATRPGK
jgi:hypothetical protein